jgi:hypothetical protein
VLRARFKPYYVSRRGKEIHKRIRFLIDGIVLAHADRNGWTQQIEAAKQDAKPAQSNAITPMGALAVTLNERKDKSRLHLSKYVVGASERAAQSNGNLEIAGQVQKVAQVNESVWPREQQQPYSPLNLQVLRQNTVISIKEKDPDSA